MGAKANRHDDDSPTLRSFPHQNVRSLANSIKKLGYEFEWIKSAEDFDKADVSFPVPVRCQTVRARRVWCEEGTRSLPVIGARVRTGRCSAGWGGSWSPQGLSGSIKEGRPLFRLSLRPGLT